MKIIGNPDWTNPAVRVKNAIVSPARRALALAGRWLPNSAAGLATRQTETLTLSGDIAGQKRLAAAWGAAMAETKSADAFTMMTGGGDPEALSTRNLAQTMANVGGAGSFLEELRRRLIAGELGRDE